MKRALVLASVASMIDQFNMPNIRLMIEMGYKVDVACNFVEGSTCSDETVAKLKRTLNEMGVDCHQIDFARNVLKVTQNLKAYRQTRRLVDENRYDLIHSHSPIGGLLSRIAARDMRKQGTRVIYTAHGFHFYKGAPLLNWIIFYPIEKISSKWTDVLVTITHEDFELAKKKMYAKQVMYVPGVGIDTKAFLPGADYGTVRKAKREELGVSEKDILMLSVGELNKNKNHEVVLDAIAALNDKRIKYMIAGRGRLMDFLNQKAQELGIEDQLMLLGFRSDVRDLFKAADIFVHPSFREGLSVAVMEAMASGLPVLCSRIRGNTDLIDEQKGGFLFDPAMSEDVSESICKILTDNMLPDMGQHNIKKAKSLDVAAIMKAMQEIYGRVRN